ncbi:alkaline phosphatase family protein [Sphingobium nicotianae]|uniref:Alkaline phosphatase n=1 Tax=Sphingobium nicotianae TaxID=2782607 RepID=A0A9X1DDE3_9SPHN|nr:alkaline phosphatase family protein [Sphingobium nicotianae]MBT2188117.1 alkaline phosphatase family protein [Sphingobium nicotianae]
MKRSLARLFTPALLAAAAPALAQPAAPPAPAQTPPKLIVVISVDQYSADLFAEYRTSYTGGLARLQQGVVFPKGYQSHAATETCPGHSTILTGNRPGHTGIIANEWIDQSVTREDKTVYCAEDPSVPGTTSSNYTVSNMRLKVPTLGTYMKNANPASRVISISGKDRAAVMMGGKAVDQIWWWAGRGFTSYKGTPLTPLVSQVNMAVDKMLDADRPAMDLPDFCKSVDRAVQVTPNLAVGNGRFARKGGDFKNFRASPEYDAAVLALGSKLVEEQKLGNGGATDLLILGLSANDYIGHTYGTRGAEMCIQQANLDQNLGQFFDMLDAAGIDYMVALTADHGGNDLPEREREQAITDAERSDPALAPRQANMMLQAKTSFKGDLILGGGPFGDFYLGKQLTPAQKATVLKEAVAYYRANRQVAAVFTKAELIAAPAPAGPPESWSLLTEAKASFDPERSGDFLVLLKPRVTPISDPDGGYVATHGSPWDYDRRVPILFWRKGMAHMEQPQGVETVDILPTIAAQIGLALPRTGIDGKCLDLDPGAASSCPAN